MQKEAPVLKDQDYFLISVKIGEEMRDVKFLYIYSMNTENMRRFEAFRERMRENSNIKEIYDLNLEMLHVMSEGIELSEMVNHPVFSLENIQILFSKLAFADFREEEKKSEVIPEPTSSSPESAPTD